ncbi:MAG: UDP-glucose 4-epimerase GalE [Rhizobiaceae bacterium]
MAILVTGGAGYIGSHMVWRLIDAGESVVVADRLSTGFEWAVAPEAKLMRGDIGDAAYLDSIFRSNDIEAIIHFAGSIVVPESVADPLSYYDNNTVKSRLLIEKAVQHKVDKFIFSSTAAVYGNVGSEPVKEQAPTLPESPYGRSKLMTEFMLADTAAAHDFRYTALRYFNVSGADPKGRTGQSTVGATHLIKVACETATGKRKSMQVFGTDYDTPDGTCLRDYIHVSDLVNAHYLALQRLRSGGTSLVANCGYGKGFSVLDVINAVRKVSGQDIVAEFAERRSGDAVSVVANSDRAQAEFGWRPEHDDLEFIVQTALDWEKSLARRNQI